MRTLGTPRKAHRFSKSAYSTNWPFSARIRHFSAAETPDFGSCWRPSRMEGRNPCGSIG